MNNQKNQAVRVLNQGGIIIFPTDTAFGIGCRIDSKEAVQKFPYAVYMVTIWSDTLGHPIAEIENTLHINKKVDVISFTSLYWKYPEVFLPYFSFNSPHKTLEQANLISQAFSLWADEASRREYLAQINWRLWSDFKVLPEPVGALKIIVLCY